MSKSAKGALSVLIVGMLLFLATLSIYAALGSQQRNYDGALQDIQRITSGSMDPNARHVLYTLVGGPYYHLWQKLGYVGDAAYPMQQWNAVFGALGALGLFLLLHRVTRRPYLAVLLTLAFAFSYGYWYYTADVFYNVSSITPLIWATYLLYLAVEKGSPLVRFTMSVGIATLCAISILGTQEHAISAVVFVFGLGIGTKSVSTKTRLLSSGVFALCLLVLLCCSYATLALLLKGCHSAACTMSWLRPYDVLWPMFGTFSLDRIPRASTSFLAAIIPLWRGLALRQLASGVMAPSKLLPQGTLMAVLLALAILCALLVVHRRRVWSMHRFTTSLALLWLFLYIPANTWLDPFSPERWIVALLPVALLLAVAFNVTLDGMSLRHQQLLALAGSTVVVLIFLSNLTQAIWPDHRYPNPQILMAQKVAGELGEGDLVVTPQWDWTLYLEAEGRHSLGLPDLSLEVAGRNPDPQRLLARLDEAISQVRDQGGRVYLVDVFSYGSDQWAWITQNTGLGPEHFEAYRVRPAWRFYGEPVWEIVGGR